jgi:hypothetical protein
VVQLVIQNPSTASINIYIWSERDYKKSPKFKPHYYKKILHLFKIFILFLTVLGVYPKSAGSAIQKAIAYA